MQILIADKFEQSGIDTLKGAGCTVVSAPDLTPDDLPDAIAEHDPEVLVVRSTKVPAPVFERAGRLSLIVRAGAGYDTIDVAAASSHGIFVANCPGKNSVAVAELAWGLILACDRRIPDQCAELRDGTWNKKLYGKARGIYGRTLGVIGLGRIGEEVVRRAHAFGMPVVAWSRSLTDARASELGVRRVASPIDVAREADVVSLHVAATPETKHLVDAAFCEALKPGAYLINTTRGSVVDEAALLDAVRTKNVRAGLDVFATEPGSGDSTSDIEIAREPMVFGTHHVG
ncbi:MAG: NAD(P)-dependent oxidoreductase, partial [Planctomycetota bacterium]